MLHAIVLVMCLLVGCYAHFQKTNDCENCGIYQKIEDMADEAAMQELEQIIYIPLIANRELIEELEPKQELFI